MILVCWIGLLLSVGLIVYQDFKQRLISIWALLAFGVFCCSLFLLEHSFDEWLENALFCLAYFLFCYLILHLFYFIKTRKFQNILDVKIGWGDVLLFLLIGSCISPLLLIYFFTVSFILALIFQFFFQKKHKDIALAGILAVCYVFFMLISNFTGLSGDLL